MSINLKLQTAIHIALGVSAGALAATYVPAAVAQDADTQERDEGNIEEVIVTGSRIRRADIDSASPVTVLAREDIEATGLTDVGSLLQRMPSMSGSPIGTTTNNGGNGTVLVDLRGMGTNRTVTLINGQRMVDGDGLRQMRELDNCVTTGTQTHASDGMATLLVMTAEKARQLSPRPEIVIQFVAKAEVRAHPALMPEAPTLAVQKLLARTGLTLADVAVVKSHNPFAINDAIFSQVMDYDWRRVNKTGCSLVWGHPQSPMGTRAIIELIQELHILGGGYGLFVGCAAGDTAGACVVKVGR